MKIKDINIVLIN